MSPLRPVSPLIPVGPGPDPDESVKPIVTCCGEALVSIVIETPGPLTKLTVSTPFAVKLPSEPPLASQYLNVLFNVTKAVLGLSFVTVKSAPLSNIIVSIFEKAVAPAVEPVGPHPTVKLADPELIILVFCILTTPFLGNNGVDIILYNN